MFSQERGTVTGKVTDKEMTGEALPFANVFIKGTSTGSTTDMNGVYTISVPEGKHTLVFSFVGYQTIEKPITVVAGQKLTINQEMGANQGVALDEVEIKATISKTKESALLLEQKKATTIKTSIGAQEISRKGVSDVATAVTKTTGISKQEGSGSVFVRGLGDRYNITTLNGLPLPSDDPNRKNLDLSIFSTDIVQSIGISKTFETQNYGDFGGASINIKSKEFTGKPYIEVSFTSKANSNIIEKNQFYLQDGPGFFGFKIGEKKSVSANVFDYTTSWDRKASDRTPANASFGINTGKSFDIGEESKLKTFFTASFNSESTYQEGIIRGNVNAQGTADRDYNINSYGYNTNTTIMGSFDFKYNSKNQFNFTSLFLNSGNQDYSEFEGFNREFDGGQQDKFGKYGFIQRGTFSKTQLFVNQLLGENQLSNSLKLSWGLGYSISNNGIPDRIQNTFVPSFKIKDYFTFFTNNPIDNHRFYQELSENELSANLNLAYKFGKENDDDEKKGEISVGFSGRYKDVDFESKLYSYGQSRPDGFGVFQFTRDQFNNVNQFFTTENINNGKVVTNINGIIGQTYFGNQNISSAYSNVKYKFTSNFIALLGVRAEFISQNVDFVTQRDPSGENSKYSELQILPSVILKYTINDKQNLKFATSKSYTLPQFKEKVRLSYEEVTQEYVGNPYVYASTNYNADLGWEYFMSRGEILSVTAFGKVIQNPINEIFVNSASGEIKYVNSGEKADITGVELELKKNILEFENSKGLTDKLTFGLNGSYIYTNQDLDSEKVSRENTGIGAQFTNNESKLTGASDILANADISFTKKLSDESDFIATIAYGYFSDKLRAIGTAGVGNIVDKRNDRLDFIFKSNISKKIKLGLNLKNLTNPLLKRVQESQNVTIQSFKKGITGSISLSYKF